MNQAILSSCFCLLKSFHSYKRTSAA